MKRLALLVVLAPLAALADTAPAPASSPFFTGVLATLMPWLVGGLVLALFALIGKGITALQAVENDSKASTLAKTLAHAGETLLHTIDSVLHTLQPQIDAAAKDPSQLPALKQAAVGAVVAQLPDVARGTLEAALGAAMPNLIASKVSQAAEAKVEAANPQVP